MCKKKRNSNLNIKEIDINKIFQWKEKLINDREKTKNTWNFGSPYFRTGESISFILFYFGTDAPKLKIN